MMGHLLKKNVSREREITNAITIEIKKRSECVHDFQVHRSEKKLSFTQFWSVLLSFGGRMPGAALVWAGI